MTVTIYEDFQCPACRDFEDASAGTLNSFQDKGTVRVQYRPIAFLDRFSSTECASRALNAAACVVNDKPAAFTAFHALLFDHQPAENSAGLTDASLAELAGQVGRYGR